MHTFNLTFYKYRPTLPPQFWDKCKGPQNQLKITIKHFQRCIGLYAYNMHKFI